MATALLGYLFLIADVGATNILLALFADGRIGHVQLQASNQRAFRQETIGMSLRGHLPLADDRRENVANWVT